MRSAIRFTVIFASMLVMYATGTVWAAVNSWSSIGPASANVQAVVVDPATTHPTETIYVGTAGAGVYKSVDGGNTWGQSNSGLTNLDVLSLAMDPFNAQIIYAGTNGGGLFKSTNGGVSWSLLTNIAVINCITIDPTNSQIIYLGTGTSLWKATNGATFTNTKVGGGGSGKPVYAIDLDPANPTIAYLGTSAGVYRFSGTTATAIVAAPLSTSDAVKGVVAETSSRAHIVSTNTSNVGKGFTSSNVNSGTVTWSLALGSTNPNYALTMFQNVLYAGTSNGVWKSTDFGVNYTSDGITGTRINAIANTGTSPATIFAGTGGAGVYAMTLSPTIGVSPTSLSYGSVDVNVSSPLTLTLSNTGRGNLVITSINVSGANSSEFILSTGGSSPCASVAPTISESQSCTMLVTFRANSPGGKSATVTVNSNDVATPAKTVALTGTGNPLPVIGVSPALKVFGSVNTGSQAQQVFTISNSGGATLNVSSAQITGIDASQFSVTTGGSSPCTATTNFTVAPSTSCTLLVTFAPTSAGAKSGALSISSNDAGSPAALALSGDGNPVAVIGVSPSVKNFGSVNIGTTSVQAFTVSNSGPTNLVVSNIAITGINSAMFSVVPGGTTPCPNLSPTLAQGASCTVNVSFTPSSSGAKSGALSITSNDPVTNPANIGLSGTGNGIAIVAVSPTVKDFGSVNIGFTAAQTFTLSNPGQADLVVSGVAAGGLNPSLFTIAPGGTNPCSSLTPTIVGGGSCDILVTFAPTSSGAKSASLDISSNDLAMPLKSIAMTGTGNAIPIASVTPATKNFGLVNVNASTTQDFSISNIGQAVLAISSITISGVNATRFSVVPGGGTPCPNLTPTIASGGSCTVRVTFTPNAAASFSAAMVISSNDPLTPVMSAAMTGTGNPLPIIGLTPAPAIFTATAVGDPEPVEFTINNTGQATLIVSSISISGPDASMFVPTTGGANPCTTLRPSISAGGSCTFLVNFTASTPGSKSATLDIVSNDPSTPMKSAAMTASGLGVASLAVNPGALVFGNEEVGAASEFELSLTNEGSADLEVTDITIGGVDREMFAVSLGGTTPCPSLTPVLASGENCTMIVTFLPLSTGPKAATVSIASNDAGSPLVINMTGNGLSNVPTAFVIINGGLRAITNSPTISFNASGSDIAGYKWKIDSGVWSAEAAVTKVTTSPKLLHGGHTLYVVGKSVSGYWPDYASAISANWFVDLVKPVTTASPGEGTYPSDRVVTLTASDDGAPGAAAPKIYFTTNGSTPTVNPALLYSGPVTVPLSATSPKVILKFFAVDAAGNAEAVKTRIYALDPVATVTGLPTPTGSSGISATVGGPGIVAYKYVIDAADIPSTVLETPVSIPITKTGITVGDHTLRVIGKNSLGAWQGAATSVTWTVENAAPTTTVDPGEGSYSGDQTVQLSCEVGSKIYYTMNGALPTVSSSSITGSGSITIPLSASSPKVVLKYFARDLAGNNEAVKTVTYALTPVAGVTGIPGGTVNVPTLVATVAGAGVVSYKYTLDNSDFTAAAETAVTIKINLAGLTTGSHTLRVIGKNSLGMWQSVPTEVAFSVDITAPGALAASPATGTFTDVQDVALSTDDSAAKIYYTLDGTTPTTGSRLYSGTPIRLTYTTTLKFMAVDTVGNASPVRIETYTLTGHATITNGLPTGPTKLSVANFTVGGTGVVAYKYNVDSNDLTTAAETPVTTKISISGLSGGLHTVHVIGKTAGGVWQTTPTTASWLVDLTPPVTTAPTGGTFSAAKIVALLCDDPQATIYYTTNGTDPTVTSPKYTAPLTMETTTTLKFFAVDRAGNAEGIQSVTYEILPVATLSGASAFVKTATVSLRVAGANVAAYKYALDANDFTSSVETAVTTAITLTSLTEGSHTIYVIGKNAGGTWQTAPTTMALTVDLTPPSTSAAITSSTNSVSFTVTDATATKIYYTVNGPPPTVVSPVYSGPFAVPTNATVRFFAVDAAGNSEAVKVAYFRPTAVLIGVPPAATKMTSAGIAVTGTGITAYKYKVELGGETLDWSPETPVATKIVKIGLANGTYKLSIIGKLGTGAGAMWQDDSAATVATWTVDNAMPVKTTISPVPGLYYLPQRVELTSPSGDPIYYTTNGTKPTAKSAKYTSAGISISTTTTLVFAAIDAAGNAEVPQKVVYQIPPTATITGIPNPSTPDITFTVGGTNVTFFRYKIDSGQWSAEFPVTSKVSLYGVPSGDRVVSVIGKNAGGSWQAVPTRVAWTVR